MDAIFLLSPEGDYIFPYIEASVGAAMAIEEVSASC